MAASGGQLYRRPAAITILAVLQFIGAPIAIIAGLGVVIAGFGQSENQTRFFMIGFGSFYFALGVLTLVCGIGLWKLKSYGRTIQIVFSCIGLLAIPIGTVISILILVYLSKPGVKLLFSETPPSRLNPAEVAEIAKLQESSGVVVALIAVVLVFVGVAFIGIIAAIAIPSLLRARVAANEAQAIGDLRAVISAELAYASANGGNFDGLECLAKPAECIPGYPVDGPVFLTEVIPAVKTGYQRELFLGVPVDRSEIAFANLSPTSAESFAYIAYPVDVGVTGARSFCADYTGRICIIVDGSRPEIVGGQCDPNCILLE